MTKVRISDWIEEPLLHVGNTVEFAIGDVHGHAGPLEALLDVIAGIADAEPSSRLTYLGDLIDHGPDSARCLALASRDAAAHRVGAVHRLLGNHEQMLRLVLRGAPDMHRWCAAGGDATLASFGIDPGAIIAAAATDEVDGAVALSRPDVAAVIRERLRAVMPSASQAGLDAMTSHRRVGQVLFVHAGISPGESVAEIDRFLAQPWDHHTVFHWAWMRAPFLLHHRPTFAGGLVVVHGHTPEPVFLVEHGLPAGKAHRLMNGRLNLDAGAIFSGHVAAAQLRNGRYRVIIAADNDPGTAATSFIGRPSRDGAW